MIPVVLTGILVHIVYLFFGMFPYGDLSLAWCDARQQVVPLLLDLKGILTGNQSVFLNLQNAGGMDLWGVLFFFVSSPLHLLTVFVPDEGMFDFVNLLVCLKLMLCAATAYCLFRRRFTSLGRLGAAVLSSMYAFSGFNLLFYQNIVWLDTAYLFPLLLIGLDRLLTERKMGLYIGILCAELFVNYYLSYMIAVFLLIAAGLYLILCCSKGERRRGTVLFIGANLIAMCLTAVVWLPSLSQFLNSARSTSLLENLQRSPLFPSLETTVPLLLCSGIFFAALFFYPYRKMKDKPELSFLLIMTVLLILPVVFEPVNRIWHTGSYQAFPARYGYMTALFMLMMSAAAIQNVTARKAKALPEEDRVARAEKAGVKTAAASLISVGVIVLLAAFLIPYMIQQREILDEYTTTLWGNRESLQALLIAAGAVAAGYGVCLFLGWLSWLPRQAVVIVLGAVFVLEAFFCGGVYMGYPASDQSGYNQVLDLKGKIQENSFYRVKTRGREVEANWMGAAGLPTLSHYTSLTSRDYLFTLKRLGYSAYWMEADSQGGTLFSDALLSNLYTVVYSDQLKAEDDLVYQNERFSIVRNPFRMPPALVASVNAEELAQVGEGDRFAAQEEIYRKLFGGQEELLTEYPVTETRGLSWTEENNRVRITLEEGQDIGLFTWQFYVDGKQTLYFDCFGGRYTTRLTETENQSCMIMVNNRLLTSSYPEKKENGILELGTFENENVKIEVRISENLNVASFGVAGISWDRLQAALNQAEGAQMEISGSTVRIETEAKEGQTLLLMLPYQEGYRAEINGRQVEVHQALSGFMAIELTDGHNRVILTYTNWGVIAGALLSAAGLVLLLLFLRWSAHLPSSSGWLMKIVGVLPGIWFTIMLGVFYIIPLLLAKGGI